MTPQDLKARPTTYNGIKMRSRLEAGFAAWLDKYGFVWEYEPHAFASTDGQYLPDFRLAAVRCSWLRHPSRVYVEVKPVMDRNDRHVPQAMATIWGSEPDAVLAVASPQGLGSGHGGGLGIVYKTSMVPGKWVISDPNGRTPGIAIPQPKSMCPWPDRYWETK
jgi:hypothetical protein